MAEKPNDRVTRQGSQRPKVPANHVPASLLQKHVKEPWTDAWPGGGVPFGGEAVVPHIYTVAGRYGIASRTYSVGDEALMDSRENALLMRNELAVMECLEARMRSTQLLPWHIGPGDEALDDRTRQRLQVTGYGRSNKWDAEDLAAKVSLILSRTRNLDKLFRSLMEAIWYGRYATEQFWKSTSIQGLSNRVSFIDHWEPRHGDKLVFRYDDGTQTYDPKQIGIRVGPGYDVQKTFLDYGGNEHRKVEATQYGLTYFLDGTERKKYAVHKHMIEDGDYARPLQAGNIHGVGIRSRIYWSWYAYTESLKLLMEYLERSALGIEIWRYPAHNPQAKAAATEAAQRRGAPGRSILMVPVPEGEQASLYDVEIVEPGLQGADVLQNVLEKFFGHKIKRYILGQTLTTEADATGLGSGMADLHAATYSDIVRSDSLSLADTITHDIVRQIQLLNFKGSEGIFLRFHFDTESPLMQSKLDAYRQLWEMGASIKTDDLYRTIGASRPNDGDDTLLNPAYGPPPMDLGAMGQGQAPPMDLGDVGSQDMMAPATEQFSADSFISSTPRYEQPIQTDRVSSDPITDEWIKRYNQGSFDFDERPKVKFDKAAKAASKTNKHGETQKGMFGDDFKPSVTSKDDKLPKKHPLLDEDGTFAVDDEEEDEDIEQFEGSMSGDADIDAWAAMEHSDTDVSVANATSRSGGAVGGNPVTVRVVKERATPEMNILDFGAGKAAAQAKELSSAGLNVTAYDFGHNAVDGLHDSSALDSQYDMVYASNVLNVQDSIEDLATTIQEIAASVGVGGVFIGNLPSSPRKGAFNGMAGGAAADTVKKMLDKYIGPTEIVEGGTSSPVFMSSKTQIQRYDAGCEMNAKMTTNGKKKDNCVLTTFSADELLKFTAAEIARYSNDE